MATKAEEGKGPAMTGHPLDGSKGGVEQHKGGTEGTPIVFGSHRFDSVKDLTDAYQKLETALGDQGRKMGEMKVGLERDRISSPASPSSPPPVDFRKLGDLLIEDTEKGVKELTGYITAEVDRRLENAGKKSEEVKEIRAREDRLWERFFTENPWLSHRKEEVKAVAYTTLWGDLEGRGPEEQFEKISGHFKETTLRSADLLEGKEVPRGRAVGMAGSRTPSETKEPSAVVEEGRKSFLDAVREKSYVRKSSF